MCGGIMLIAMTARRLPPMVLFLTMLYTAGISVLAFFSSLQSFRTRHAMSHLYEVPNKTYPLDYWILAAMGAVICINIGLVLAWMLANAERNVE